MEALLGYAKFLVKRLSERMRAFFLSLFGRHANEGGWESRMLIVNFEAIGDLVMFTAVLKHYRKRFPGVSLTLLIKSGTGMEPFLKGHFVDSVISVRYRKFLGNPFYGFGVINRLRAIGFHTVINHDFSVAEIAGKQIAVSLGAREVIGYEGQHIEYRHPYDIQQERNLKIITRSLLPRFTRVIRALSENVAREGRSPNEVEHYIAIYEAITGAREDDYATFLPLPSNERERADALLEPYGIDGKQYVVLNINSSDPCKRWPLERFAKLAGVLHGRGFAVVLVGAPGEEAIGLRFESLCASPIINITGKTSLEELVILVRHSFLVLSNDTSTVHIAIAQKRPSICIVGGGQFGVATDYGYSDLNHWVWKRTPCYFDNWRCRHGLSGDEPSPCVGAVTYEIVAAQIAALLKHLDAHPTDAVAPFTRRFPLAGDATTMKRGGSNKLKIIYTGIRYEHYNPERKQSFEYAAFYSSLKDLPNVHVIEYAYDRILDVGKEKFNDDLLALVEKERPDLVFAFMFTDELDYDVLDKIKKITTSVAWFADDHWRLDNYSRFYAPHFTWAVTTWSEASRRYARYGITNVIRSQWACNPSIWKPVDVPRDIEVSFIGQQNSSRVRVIRELRDAGVDVWVRGWGWPEGRLTQEEAVREISMSKINLNINVPPRRWRLRLLARLFMRRSLGKIVFDLGNFGNNIRSWANMSTPQIKARPFEILGCRTFLISGVADDMPAYYEDGKEIVYYDGTTADLIGKIKFYLTHPEDRERIAQAGYARTLRGHTYALRFTDLFAAIGLDYHG